MLPDADEDFPMRSLWSLIWLLLLTSSLRADEYELTIRSESNESALVEITLPEGADADRSWELLESRNDPSDKARHGRPTQPVIGDRRRLLALLTPREWNQKCFFDPCRLGESSFCLPCIWALMFMSTTGSSLWRIRHTPS